MITNNSLIHRTIVSNENDILFEKNVTTTALKDKKLIDKLVLFVADGARPNFLFGNNSYKQWQPFFNTLLTQESNHTSCTKMKVDPPTSTTQGIKTLLTGGMPSFIEIGQAFFSEELSSDHFLKQANRSGLK